MEQVLEALPKHPEIKEVYLHVWTKNEDAIRFYNRYGFEIAETVEGYYRGIDPTSCHILRKAVNGIAPASTATQVSK